jgi:hypothetical protein
MNSSSARGGLRPPVSCVPRYSVLRARSWHAACAVGIAATALGCAKPSGLTGSTGQGISSPPGGPVIFRVSESAAPNVLGQQVVSVQGANFGTSPSVCLGYAGQSDVPSNIDCKQWIEAACPSSDSTMSTEPAAGGCLLTASSTQLAVALPRDLAAPGVGAALGELPFFLKVNDGTAVSAPVGVNVPRITQLEFSEVEPNVSFKIFGRNLVLGGKSTVTLLPVSGGTPITFSASGDSYMISAAPPATVKERVLYNVQVSTTGPATIPGTTLAAVGVSSDLVTGRAPVTSDHNYGLEIPGQADYPSSSTTVTVTAPPKTSSGELAFPAAVGKASIPEPSTPYDAANADADDQPAIQGAIDYVASLGGGVVYLPAGAYALKHVNPTGQGANRPSALAVPPQVVLKGAGETETTLLFGYQPSPGYGSAGLVFVAATVAEDATPTPTGSGVMGLTLQNLNRYGVFTYTVTPTNADGSTKGLSPVTVSVNSFTANNPATCTIEESLTAMGTPNVSPSPAQTGATAAPGWGLPVTIDDSPSNPAAKIFVKDVTVDQALGWGEAVLYGQVDVVSNLELDGLTVLKGPCYHGSSSSLDFGGRSSRLVNSTIHNYYERNTEISGIGLVAEANTFIYHRDHFHSLLVEKGTNLDGTNHIAAYGVEGANNGGPEYGGSQLVLYDNKVEEVGVPPIGDVESSSGTVTTSQLNQGSTLAT